MKEKILTNVRIIDPSQKMDEIGNIIIDDKGKIKSIGKNTKISDVSKSVEKIDLKGNEWDPPVPPSCITIDLG